MQIRQLFAAIFSTSFILAAPPDAKAQDGLPDLAAIKEAGQLVVAMTSFDSAPFYVEDHGHVTGIDAELAEAIASALGVEVEFDRSAETFNGVVDLVHSGEADIAISKISRTYARAQIVAFSYPYVRLRNALMFSRLKLAQNLQGRDLGYYIRHFDGSLGVIQNSSFATFARTDFPDTKIVAYPTWEQVVEATTNGDVDAAYGDEFEIRRITVDHPETSISLRTVTITDAQDAISVVVPWDAPRLLAIVNQVIDNQPEAMTTDDVNDLYRLSVETEGGH